MRMRFYAIRKTLPEYLLAMFASPQLVLSVTPRKKVYDLTFMNIDQN
jgi:hypothetical protein